MSETMKSIDWAHFHMVKATPNIHPHMRPKGKPIQVVTVNLAARRRSIFVKEDLFFVAVAAFLIILLAITP